MNGRICRIAFLSFAAFYGLALVLLAIGTFGLFGSDEGPLAGVFLAPLGLPWNLLVDGAPSGLAPWLAAGAPLLNLLLIGTVCRLMRSRS